MITSIFSSMKEPKDESPEPIDLAFQARRLLVFTIISLLYAIVTFQRVCPSIVAADMALDYGVEKSELGIFSSLFFYSYGLVQPFTGLLSDVIEPAYLIGISQLVAAIGAIICGSSTSLSVGCFGRFLVGLGCGPTYVPVCRCLVNWFPLEYYPHMTGVLMAVGGIGSIIAQGPLASLAGTIGWTWSFYGIGAIGGLFSLLCLLFVRGNPVTLGFPPVNKDLTGISGDISVKDRLRTLWENFKTVVSFRWFWVTVTYCIFANGAWFDIAGMWIAPFLEDIFHYTRQEAGNTSMALSIGLIAGSLTIPPLSTWLRTRKWALCVTSLVALSISLSFAIVAACKIPYWALYLMLALLGACTNAMTAVAYPLLREYYHPSVAGSAVGCANTFTFLSSAIYQSISSEIIKEYKLESDGAKTEYTVEGYKNALWFLCTASFAAAAISIALTRDTVFAKQTSTDEEYGMDQTEEEKEHADDGPVLNEL
jgi:sugar phosphate permease